MDNTLGFGLAMLPLAVSIGRGEGTGRGLIISFSTSSNFDVAHGAIPTVGVAIVFISKEEMASLEEYQV